MGKENMAYPYNRPLVLNRRGILTHTTKSWTLRILSKVKGVRDKNNSTCGAHPLNSAWPAPPAFQTCTPGVWFFLLQNRTHFWSSAQHPSPHSLHSSHYLSLLGGVVCSASLFHDTEAPLLEGILNICFL